MKTSKRFKCLKRREVGVQSVKCQSLHSCAFKGVCRNELSGIPVYFDLWHLTGLPLDKHPHLTHTQILCLLSSLQLLLFVFSVVDALPKNTLPTFHIITTALGIRATVWSEAPQEGTVLSTIACLLFWVHRLHLTFLKYFRKWEECMWEYPQTNSLSAIMPTPHSSFVWLS